LCDDIFELVVNKHNLIDILGAVLVDLMADRGSNCKVNWCLNGCGSLGEKIWELPAHC
jgi:hypothetical protein